MGKYEAYLRQFQQVQLNPPYAGEEILQIRGIALPEDYRRFLRAHNGGVLRQDDSRLVIFSLEEILKGDCFRDDEGYYLGSARSQSQEYQNPDTQTCTTPNGISCEDSKALYQAFYDDHVVIGYREKEASAGYPYVTLIAIDRAGNYRMLCDGDGENLGRYEFGTCVKTPFGGYVRYDVCLYESPMGLLEVRAGSGDKLYRIVSPDTLEEWKKKYSFFRKYGLQKNPHWEYDILDAEHSDEKGWRGNTMEEVFSFCLIEL